MSDFWKRKNKKGLKSPPVGVVLGKRAIKGDVGLEIEVEGNKFKKEDLPSPWTYTHDGSLRGADNAEYVLARPIPFASVPTAVNDLWKMMKDFGSVLDESNRTSVHVHLNCQSFHFNRLASFTALYFIFEGILTEWCGEHRVGNLFCLRGKDAPAIITDTRNFIAKDGNWPLSDHLHYAGLNIQALWKFGSLEIRTLQGVRTPEPIIQWVDLLRRLYDLSAEFTDPRDICGLFSAEGPLAFYDKVLGDYGAMFRAELGFDDERIRDELYEGIRLAQDICYARDWDTFQPEEVSTDPFGRKKKAATTNALEALATGPSTLTYASPATDQWNVDAWFESTFGEQTGASE